MAIRRGLASCALRERDGQMLSATQLSTRLPSTEAAVKRDERAVAALQTQILLTLTSVEALRPSNVRTLFSNVV
jgi:hypothetical protein